MTDLEHPCATATPHNSRSPAVYNELLRPQQHTIFEEEERRPNTISYAERRREQRHLDICWISCAEKRGFQLRRGQSRLCPSPLHARAGPDSGGNRGSSTSTEPGS